MNKILAWRNKRLHRRCEFCRHFEHRGGLEFSHWVCKAKSIIFCRTEINFHRPFCSLFELKEEDHV